MSDLHLEFHADNGVEFIKSLEPAGEDVLVLAGDITNSPYIHKTLIRFAERFPKTEIVYVMGNHCYYGSTYAVAQAEARSLSFMRPRVHFLNNDFVEIGGQRFVGATGWYPILTEDAMFMSKWRKWSDSRAIEDAETSLPGRYEDTIEAFEGLILPTDVVVTHMLPTPRSIVEEWQGVSTNIFFLADATALIAAKRPKLWIHGHTHSHIDYLCGKTHVVANPMGFPGENPKFRVDRIIEV